MTLTIEATYEDGVLKPTQPLPLQQHERVKLTLESLTKEPAAMLDEAEQSVRRSHGLIGWSGDLETLRGVAEEAEFSRSESP